MSLLPNYSPFFAATLGTIYSRRWEPAPKYEGRSLLLSTPPIQNIAFWHVQVRPRGEVYVPPEWVEQYLSGLDSTSPPIIPGQNLTLPEYTLLANANGVSQLDGQGRTYGSIFKIRMRWKEGGGTELRQIDCDLGAGIDVITPPASFVEIVLLSPVAGSELSLPPAMREIPLGTALHVEARADCIMGTAERNFNAKFTDIVYFDRTEGQDRNIIIPRRLSTTRFQASTTSLFGVINTKWDRNPPGTPGDPFRRLDTGEFAAQLGDRNTAINDIPGGTNVFQYTFPLNVQQATLSVVQELSL